MFSVIEAIGADDVRDMNLRIGHTEALLRTLREARDARVEEVRLRQMAAAEAAFEERLLQDATEPGRDYME
jgi:hypothetical protein